MGLKGNFASFPGSVFSLSPYRHTSSVGASRTHEARHGCGAPPGLIVQSLASGKDIDMPSQAGKSTGTRSVILTRGCSSIRFLVLER